MSESLRFKSSLFFIILASKGVRIGRLQRDQPTLPLGSVRVTQPRGRFDPDKHSRSVPVQSNDVMPLHHLLSILRQKYRQKIGCYGVGQDYLHKKITMEPGKCKKVKSYATKRLFIQLFQHFWVDRWWHACNSQKYVQTTSRTRCIHVKHVDWLTF